MIVASVVLAAFGAWWYCAGLVALWALSFAARGLHGGGTWYSSFGRSWHEQYGPVEPRETTYHREDPRP